MEKIQEEVLLVSVDFLCVTILLIKLYGSAEMMEYVTGNTRNLVEYLSHHT